MSANTPEAGVLPANEVSGTASVPSPAHSVLTARPDQRAAIEVTYPGGASKAAFEQFAQCVREFAMALSRETSRLEEAERADTIQEAEITATMVVKANNQVRNPSSNAPPPVPPWPLAAQIAAFTAAIFAGVFGSYLNSVWQWATMASLSVLAVTAQAYAIVALRRRR